MKKITFLILFTFLSTITYSQYRWEVSGGLVRSKINLENTTTDYGNGFYLNAGYGYVMGVRARTSIVFSLDFLQKSSRITEDNAQLGFSNGDEIKTMQFGFTPKFRFLFGEGKDKFRPFINVGPSFRVNSNFEIGGEKLESSAVEQIIIGGVYGAGFSVAVKEMFDIMGEFGVMNDFVDNLVNTESKFFDIYARVGIRYRIYDARR